MAGCPGNPSREAGRLVYFVLLGGLLASLRTKRIKDSNHRIFDRRLSAFKMDLGIGHARTMYMLYASRTPRLIQLVRKRLKLFFGLPKILWASLGKSLENFSSLNSSVCSFGRAAEVKYLRIRLHLTGVYKHGIPQKDSLQHTYFVQYHPRLFSVSFSLRSWFPWVTCISSIIEACYPTSRRVTCISSIIEAFYPTPRSAFLDLLQHS